MTYEYTDKELNLFNQEETVYSVDPKLARNKGRDVITDKPSEMLQGGESNRITIGNQYFRVVSVKNDRATGFQGMAVAPIVNGQVDTNSVAVVAPGTTPTDVNDFIFVLRKK